MKPCCCHTTRRAGSPCSRYNSGHPPDATEAPASSCVPHCSQNRNPRCSGVAAMLQAAGSRIAPARFPQSVTPAYSRWKVLVVLFSARVTGMTLRDAKRYRAVASSADRVVCSSACLKVIMQPSAGLSCTGLVADSTAAIACRPACMRQPHRQAEETEVTQQPHMHIDPGTRRI